jgi:GNAT superfamily N-acetyltransferase
VLTVRPMTEDDVPGAEEAWHQAFSTMRAAYHLPVEERTPEGAEHTRRRIAHLLATDPGGAWVAADQGTGEVIGLSQALRRGDLWVLSLLGVSPRGQNRGVGKALLDAALSYGGDCSRGMILSSRDPRAAHRYLKAGFAMHPSVVARGAPHGHPLPTCPDVRPGHEEDQGLVSDLDTRLRGGAHGPDLNHVLADGARLLVFPDHGYVVARAARPLFLAADSDEAAVQLLSAALASAEPGEVVEVNWITAHQQWALRTAVEAGMEVHPVGSVMLRGFEQPPPGYLPSGAFG